MTAQYQVELQEHDSTSWDAGHLFTKAGAWKHIRGLAARMVPGWPHPLFVRVYVVRKDEKTLVWAGDLRNVSCELAP